MNSLDLTEAVGHIYDAALDTERWEDALQSTVGFVGGERGMVGITNTLTGVLDVTYTFGLDPVLMGRWESEFGREDPWAESMVDMVEGQVGRGSDLKSYEALEKSATFREVVVPLGVYDTCWTALASNRVRKGFLSAFQGRDRGPFPRESVERMAVLAPHLVRSARIHAQLDELRARSESVEAAVDQLSFALLTCTAEARVVTLNRRAEMHFERAGVLRLATGQLSCVSPEQGKRLRDLISRASATAVGTSSEGGGVVALRTSEALGDMFTATVVPLPIRTRSPLHSTTRGVATALVTITHPGQSLRIPEGALNELFGLARSEAQLALALAEGRSLSEYASLMGISIGTARWTLKNVHSKTGVARQAELVALIHQSLAPLVDAPTS